MIQIANCWKQTSFPARGRYYFEVDPFSINSWIYITWRCDYFVRKKLTSAQSNLHCFSISPLQHYYEKHMTYPLNQSSGNLLLPQCSSALYRHHSIFLHISCIFKCAMFFFFFICSPWMSLKLAMCFLLVLDFYRCFLLFFTTF